MFFNVPYSGLNVTMVEIRWKIWSSLLVLTNHTQEKPVLTDKLPRRRNRNVLGIIMLFLLWKDNDGQLPNVRHVTTCSLDWLKKSLFS